MPKNTVRSRWSVPVAFTLALAVGLVGCNDALSFDWSATPDTVQLYALSRPEINVPSAFSFAHKQVVDISVPGATGVWDLALDTQGQSLVLLPPGALGITSRAAIAPYPGMAFDDITKAPSGQDTLLFVGQEAVPVQEGTVYVVRTNRQAGSFGATCVYYAKMAPVEIDAAGGTLRFEYVADPICNSLDLVPPNQ